MSTLPMILERTSRGDRMLDVYSRLFMERNVFLVGPIEQFIATDIIAQMLYLESQNSDADINLYIASGGGEVTAGLSIISTMRRLKCNVSTICLSQSASMAAVILSSGTRGKRFATEFGEIMIHQVKSSVGWSIQTADINIQAERVNELNYTLTKIIADNCRRDFNEVLKDMDRDNFMTSKCALEYGLIDKVI